MIQFGETLESEKILKLLSHSLPYYLKSWHDNGDGTGLFGTVDPESFNMRKIGSSSPVIEYVVRPHIHVLAILSVYINRDFFNQEDTAFTRNKAVDMVTKGVRWICETHLTGSRDVDSFLERKRWGENWRSGLWSGMLALCAYLLEDVLDEDLHSRVNDILAFEANRFVGVLPPSGCEIDTKLEENAQDTMVLAWAANMLPDHDNREAWEQTLCRWAINIATRIDDKADHSEYFGRSVSRWVTTQTLHPDITAENHGFFHPEILSYSAWIVLAMSAYTMHGKEAPQFLRRKIHQDTFDVLLRFCLPTGMVYPPGSNDLPMFVPRPFMLAWGLWNNDARALTITSRLLGWMDTILEHQSGPTDVPWICGFEAHHEGWELLFQSQVGFELALLAALPFQKEARFFSSGQIENAVDTREIYRFVEVCFRRNIRTTRSAAWKAIGKHPMAGINIHSFPELVAPQRAAMLGIPRIGTEIKYWEVDFHNDRGQRDGFDTYGRISYYGVSREHILTRDVRLLTWGDEGMVVFDQIRAEKDLDFDEQFLSPVYLVNDRWTNNKLELTSGSLHETVRASRSSDRIVSCPSFWASVESSLLFQFVWGRSKGLIYVPGNERNAPRYWKNCRLDMLAVHVGARDCTAGSVIYEVGFYVGAGKSPRPFKSAGTCGEFFKGLVIMDGKNTVGLN